MGVSTTRTHSEMLQRRPFDAYPPASCHSQSYTHSQCWLQQPAGGVANRRWQTHPLAGICGHGSHCHANPPQLKCNRELPSCARCLRVGLSCAFPDPPDRKLLAATRINARKRKAEGTLHNDQEILESRASTKISSYSSTASTNTTTYLPSNASYSEKGSSTEHYDDLSRPLRLLLIETYFKHMYNAWLLFHEPTFLVDVDAGQVPPYVLLSIYATATMYDFKCCC